jgi:hypothetical protein
MHSVLVPFAPLPRMLAPIVAALSLASSYRSPHLAGLISVEWPPIISAAPTAPASAVDKRVPLVVGYRFTKSAHLAASDATPQGWIGTVEVEFFGDPSISLSV